MREEPGRRLWKSSSQARLYLRTTWGLSRKSESVPQGTFSKAPCTLRRNDFSFIFSSSLRLSVSVHVCLRRTRARTHTRAHTHTCTGLALAHREQQGARLSLAAALSSSCIWAGAQRHRGTRREHREGVLASTPTSSPPLTPVPKENRTQCLKQIHPFSHGNGRVSQRPVTHQPAGAKLRFSHTAFIL